MLKFEDNPFKNNKVIATQSKKKSQKIRNLTLKIRVIYEWKQILVLSQGLLRPSMKTITLELNLKSYDQGTSFRTATPGDCNNTSIFKEKKKLS
jgi:hypothetical protein